MRCLIPDIMNSFGAATPNGVRNLWNCPVGKRRITATPRWSNRSRAVIIVDDRSKPYMQCGRKSWPFDISRVARMAYLSGAGWIGWFIFQNLTSLILRYRSVRRADMRTYFANWSALLGPTVIFMLIERSAQLSQVVPLDACAVSRPGGAQLSLDFYCF